LTRPAPSTATAATAPATFLADLTAGLSAGRDPQSLLQRFLAPLLRLAGAQGGSVRVLNEGDERLHLVGTLGPSASVCGAGEAVDRHCGVCGRAADGADAAWAADLSNCRAPSLVSGAAGGAQRVLAVPLRHQGRVLGVYTLFFDQAAPLSPDVLGLLDTVGELLGLALAHARDEAQRLNTTLAQERRMLAADVHDGVAQSLSFVKMRLPLLQDAMQAGDLPRAQQYLNDVNSAAGQAQGSLRSLMTQMRTPIDPLGLLHALEASAQAFRRNSATMLEFDNQLPDLQLPPDEAAQVFHVVQEALNNVARHAGARHAWLRIAAGAPGWAEIVIDDDGAGLAPGSGGGSHYGLAIMQDRARRIGGSLSVGARPGGGTRVRLAFPCRVSVAERPSTVESR
jgi:two-component system, NarL family, nitrate/nitrite sensor histidine kinase NarX